MSPVPAPQWIGLFYFVSEVGLSIFKRAKSSSTARDEGSIGLLWTVIVLSIIASSFAMVRFGGARSQALIDLRAWWFVLCVAGIALRWWAIIHLGRFFTVNVAIAADHRVIDDGPYRFVRHPSYTGALLSFVGLGLTTGNWIAAALLVVPISAAFLRRKEIEERALVSALGEPYRVYSARTKRLVPFLY